jgi:hypothetical protein
MNSLPEVSVQLSDVAHHSLEISADLIIIDEVSVLTPWVANRVVPTLQSISGDEQLEFGR